MSFLLSVAFWVPVSWKDAILAEIKNVKTKNRGLLN